MTTPESLLAEIRELDAYVARLIISAKNLHEEIRKAKNDEAH